MNPDDIQAIFLQECEEGLGSAETALLAIRSGEYDAETINTIFRAVHSIKGGAGAFGFGALQAYTHQFETLLDKVRDGDLAVTPPLVDLLIAAFDLLADHVGAIRGECDRPDDVAMVERLVAALVVPAAPAADAVAAAEAQPSADLDFDLSAMMAELADAETGEETVVAPALVATPAGLCEWEVGFAPTAADMQHGGEPLLLVRELVRLGGRVLRVDTDRIPALDRFEPEAACLSWTLRLPLSVEEGAIREVFDFIADPASLSIMQADADAQADTDADAGKTPEPAKPAAIAAPAAPPAPHVPTAEETKPAPAARQVPGATIRVDLEKLDRLVDLVGELVITQSMLSQRLGLLGISTVEELNDLDQLTRELQDSAMAIRAQPVKSVFSRIPRIVRELESSTGKRVRLEVEGEATELDKTVIERIGEPLTHLVRNCVDHGIESPEDRLARGKPAEGTLRLAAEHKGSRIVISVSDDGAGINRARVLALAVERGIVPADARLTDEEIDQLIFAPGFSTAKTVSNISGRGVGMDVVRQNVQALGGRITIQSTPGEGSLFALALPLTLAIADGMIVRVGDQTYIIPLTHVVESLRPGIGAVQKTGRGTGVLNVRGAYLPVLGVGEQLGIADAIREPSEAVLIVVETESAGAAILMVDTIVDQRQVVIKSLESHYQQVDGVAGATILGDGQVALILDVEGLIAIRTGGARAWAS